MRMYNELEIFGNKENYSKIIDELFEYGDSHSDMHNCFERALELAKKSMPIDYSINEVLIKEVVFEILEDLVLDRIEDFIRHRWEFTDYSTEDFVQLLNAPLSALECTRNRFLCNIHLSTEIDEKHINLIQ
jgi:hypothetical protein